MTSRRDFIHTASLALAGLGLTTTPLFADEQKLHLVRKGETLSAIGKRYDVSVASLKTANKLKSDTIRVGQRLVIPTKKASAAQPVTPATPALLAEVIRQTKTLRIQPGRWRHVVAHHSAIERGNAAIYHQGHLRRGMENGLAYHFVIGNGVDSKDGQIEIGSRWLKQQAGGHVRNQFYNEHGIGICLVGNLQNHAPTARQLASLTALIDWLRGDAPLGVKPAFTVHRWVDRNHTVCPGRHFPYTALQRRYA